MDNAAAYLTGWFARAAAQARADTGKAALEAHAARKRAEAEEARLAKQLDGPADARPIGADISRLVAVVRKGVAK